MVRKLYYLVSFFVLSILPFNPVKSLADVMDIELIYIQGGCYQMGDTFGDGEYDEWEFACRNRGQNIKFGTQTGHITPDLANYGSEKFGEGSALDGFEFTAPVGSYPPNQLGLYDMSGNVWEWVSDWKEINDNYYQRSPEENPQGAEKTRRKVGRGGSWNFSSKALRCSNRFSNWTQANCLSYGFRIAKDAIR